MRSIERFIDEALSGSGLATRGAFALEAGEGLEGFSSGVLIGHLGGTFWPIFRAWHAAHPGIADPLDAWSKAIIGDVAHDVQKRAVFPSDKPHLPFQRWAARAEGLKHGPLGVLMHPQAGPWHAYRGAILFEQPLEAGPPQKDRLAAHPCDMCAAKPCLAACPVNAVSPDRFDVEACRAHLASPEGAPCMTGGCLARNACPAGGGFRYSAEQQAFHQAAFSAG
jgi:ferredoxin